MRIYRMLLTLSGHHRVEIYNSTAKIWHKFPTRLDALAWLNDMPELASRTVFNWEVKDGTIRACI